MDAPTDDVPRYQKQALTVFTGDIVLAQLANGEGWRTMVTLVNLENVPATATVWFVSDFGDPLSLPIVGLGTYPGVSFTIPVNGSGTFETAGGTGAVTQGWAFIESNQRVGAMAIFRWSHPVFGGPIYEAVVPAASPFDKRQVLPFDHTAGYRTGVAIANFSTSAITILATLRNEQGQVFGSASLTLGPARHGAWFFQEVFPSSIGRRGTVEFTTGSTGMVPLGLRISASGIPTTLFPMASPLW